MFWINNRKPPFSVRYLGTFASGTSTFSDSSIILNPIDESLSKTDEVDVVAFDAPHNSALQSIFEDEVVDVDFEGAVDFNSILEVLEEAGSPPPPLSSVSNDTNELESVDHQHHQQLVGTQRRSSSGEAIPEVIHSCKICDRIFDTRQDLLKHYSTHSRDKNSLLCSSCGFMFHSTVDLLIHRKQHEKANDRIGPSSTAAAAKAAAVGRRRRTSSSNSLSEDVIPPEIHRSKNTVYRCLHCSKPFFVFAQLMAHQENHCANKEQLYKCSQCSESFTSLDRLIVHETSHKDESQGVPSFESH